MILHDPYTSQKHLSVNECLSYLNRIYKCNIIINIFEITKKCNNEMQFGLNNLKIQ